MYSQQRTHLSTTEQEGVSRVLLNVLGFTSHLGLVGSRIVAEDIDAVGWDSVTS